MDLSPRGSQVTIDTGTIIRFFLVGVLLFILYYLFDVLLVLIAAIVIASAIEPVIRRMQRHKVHRIVGVVLVYLLIAVIFAILVLFFIPLVVTDMVDFLRTLPATVSLQDLWGPIQNIGFNFGSISSLFSDQAIPISDFVNTLQSTIIGGGAGALKIASLIFGGMLSFVLIVVLSFYLSVQEDGVDDFLRIVTPVKHHDYIIDLWKRSQRKIGYWLQGQILLGVVVGVLVYLVLMIVGIPHALVLAILAGLLEIIPVFGPIIAAVPAVLVAFANLSFATGLLLIGLYFIIQQFENQLFYPLVVKKIVGISPIVVILALVIGAKLAGVLGAILAVPLSAAFMEYISDIEKRKKHEKASGATM